MVIGDINIDVVIAAKEYPNEGSETVVEHSDFRLGGSACNTAVTMARLGTKVFQVGNLGVDPFGNMALDFIQTAGVDTRLIRQDVSFQTGFFLILITQGGQRTMFGSRGCNIMPPDFEKVAVLIPDIDLLHVSGYSLIDNEQALIVQRLIKTARQQGKKISLDPGMCTIKMVKDKIYGILPFLDYFLPSRQELLDFVSPLSEQDGIRKLLDCGVKAITLKEGERGSSFYAMQQELHQPAIQSEKYLIHDTTGAGDCFNAGFLFSILEGLEPEHCLLLGNLTAFSAVIAERGMVNICLDENYSSSLNKIINELDAKSQIGLHISRIFVH